MSLANLAMTTLTSMLDRMEAAKPIYIFLTEEARGLEQKYNEATEEIL